MKIVIDLQCCQTEAQYRGIGRHAFSLTKEIVRLGTKHDFLFLLNTKYLDRSSELIKNIRDFSDLGKVIVHDYPNVQLGWHDRQIREQIANVLRNDRIETVCPDLYHVPSVFEGESIWGPAAAYIDLPKAPIIRSALMHDFIPLLYQEHYLNDWPVALWYKRSFSVAQQFDILLTNSNSTKMEAERLLRFKAENVVNVFGAADDRFRVLPEDERRAGDIWKRLDLTSPFLLYVGGPDFRKNLYGALEAFAIANKDLNNKYKFVIVYDVNGSEAAELQALANKLGISSSVVVTGFVSDQELVELYNNCALFVFPSLYEGLGLPVIEAMRCGAPTLVGDNSSMVEIVDEAQFRFDASSASDMARSFKTILLNADMLRKMRAYSLDRAAQFTWEKSARRALDAWEEAYAARKPKSPQIASPRLPRIAMFTPLPPAKTGIADYSAEFIPALSRHAHMEIFVEDVSDVSFDLEGTPVRHHSQFPFLSQRYDAIVYQLGNSPFHHYMLPYLKNFPGIVVLHDAYLGYLTYDPGNPGPFIRRTIRDHGGPARSLALANDSFEAAARALIQEFSCSAVVAQSSLGVLTHSRFAHDVIMADAPNSSLPQIAVIQQYRAPQEKPVEKAVARKKLGIPEDVCLIVTLGHVAHTKGILELIEGFAGSKASASGKTWLIMVGELEGGAAHDTPYAQNVLKALRGKPTVKITGFVDKEDYDLYLAAADIGIQLRTTTRGETSGAILNMLMNGVPFIYNRMGPSAELPAEVALALNSYSSTEVTRAIDALAGDPKLRQNYRRAALNYAKEALDPDKIGAEFVRLAVSMTERSKTCGPKIVSRSIAQFLRDAALTPSLTQEIAQAYVRQERSELRPRLLLDVTHIRDGDLKTGVQRVVRELTRAAYSWPDPRLRAQAFAYTERGLIHADDYAQDCNARAPVEGDDVRHGPLEIRPFDKILMADGTWHLSDWMHAPVERLNALGGEAYGLVHDILPLQHPELFHDHVRVSITKWLSLLLEKGAGLICTSKTGADAVIEHVQKNEFHVREGLRVGYAKLGADFASKLDAAAPIEPVTAELTGRDGLFLMVGTIEPRKGHAYVLDGFERLWASGSEATLVFVGKSGWDIDALLQRFEAHPEKNRRFFYLGFMPEADVAALYRHATATIVASIAEGFGLPIYEAANFGTPLLLSDIGVFRELAGENAGYFDPNSATSVADAVSRLLRGEGKRSAAITAPSWQDCAKSVFGFLDGQNTYFQF